MSGAKPIDPQTSVAEDASAPTSVGRYLVFDEIGVGGMASVHLGMLTGAVGFRRIVALKQLHSRFIHDPDFVAQFINEARLASRIHHANVVQTLDVVWTGTQLLLVLEYVDGDTLNRVLRTAVERGVQVPIDVACGMVTGVLHGLHAAHDVRDEEGVPLDIVHRDVSPQNILVARDGVARVLDFGVAKALAQSPNTQSGLLKGKFGYMAPEQILRGHVDRRTDVFAAGVVLWETLTCRRLFQSSKNIEQALARVVAADIPAPSAYRPEIPPALDAIVLRAVERDPVRRFQSAEELAVALEGVGGASPHLVKTWFSPFASPELVQRASLIRAINRRYGPPGRSTPHPSELAEEARLALASARAMTEANERPAESAVQAPRRSGRFAMHLGWGRAKFDSGIIAPRGPAPSSRKPVDEYILPTTRSPGAEPAPEEANEQRSPLRISARHAGGAFLALVMLVATWVTAVGQTALPPMRASGPGPEPAVLDETLAPPRPDASGALDPGPQHDQASAARERALAGPTLDGPGSSLRKPERVTVPVGELELRPAR